MSKNVHVSNRKIKKKKKKKTACTHLFFEKSVWESNNLFFWALAYQHIKAWYWFCLHHWITMISTTSLAVALNILVWADRRPSWLIVFGLNDMSTLEGNFVLSPRERKKREKKIVEEMKERDREEKGTGMKVKKQKKQEYRWNRWMLPEHAIVGTGNIILDKERYTVYTHCTSKWSITKPVGRQISLPEGTVIQTSAT